jgi:hypothetical protein
VQMSNLQDSYFNHSPFSHILDYFLLVYFRWVEALASVCYTMWRNASGWKGVPMSYKVRPHCRI